ncbi:MAG: ACP S-malonyltransferase [Puniceicoccales bacterium]|nr:ACP S-malonyltransferase [Puniceicoccales bacterium]
MNNIKNLDSIQNFLSINSMAKVGIIFPGQGSQFVGMGKSLYDNDIIVREHFKAANRVLGYDLASICFNGPLERLTESRFCQPALFIHAYVSYLMVMMEICGIENPPDVIFGLSVGEIIALTIAGVLSFDAGLRLVERRGIYMQEACQETKGKMVALVGNSRKEVEILCKITDVYISNFNAPDQMVISGGAKEIDKAIDIAKKMKFSKVIELNVAGAFHSPLMESAKIRFKKYIKDIEFNEPKINIISNVTGKFMKDPDEIKSLLCEQIVSEVRWVDCMKTAIDHGVSKFYQCGPGKTLVKLAKRIDKNVMVKAVGEVSDVPGLPYVLDTP